MSKIIKKIKLNASQVEQVNTDPTKGTQANPFTQEEMHQLQAQESWNGGYVESVGYSVPMMIGGMDSGTSGSNEYPPYLETLLNSIPYSVRINLPYNLQFVFTTSEAINNCPAIYNASNKIIFYTSDNYDVFYRECIHAVQDNIGIMSSMHAASEFQEHIIGDIRSFIATMNDEYATPSLTTVYGVSEVSEISILYEIISEQGIINLSRFLTQVPILIDAFQETHPTIEEYQGHIDNNFDFKWAEMFTIMGIRYQ